MTIILKIIPFALILFGSLFAVGSAVFVLRRRAFLKKALQTNGTVVDVEVRHSSGTPGSIGSIGSGGATYYYPTVRFQTADGRMNDCRINVNFSQIYAVGQQVIVNYDPQNPCRATVLGDRNSQPVFPLIMFGFVGTIFVLFGLVWGVIVFFLPPI